MKITPKIDDNISQNDKGLKQKRKTKNIKKNVQTSKNQKNSSQGKNVFTKETESIFDQEKTKN